MGEGRRVGKANLIGLKNLEERGFLWVSAGGDAVVTSLNRMEGRGEDGFERIEGTPDS